MRGFGAALNYLMQCARGAVAVALLLACAVSAAAETSLAEARDLATDGKSAAQSGVPVIVLVSLAGCPHCEVVRRYHLLPLLRDGIGVPKPVIRQVEVSGRKRLRDFDGKDITHGEFARRYKANIAPVVFFFSADGALLAKPLVGSMIPDFYGAYFDAAFNEAKSKLSAPQLQTRPPKKTSVLASQN